MICRMDLKTKGREIIHKIKVQHRPTCLFQLEDNIIVGTEAAHLEVWDIYKASLKSVYDTHLGTGDCGITAIVELKNPSYLITGELPGTNKDRFLVTAASSSSHVKVFRVKNNEELQGHLKIETSLSGGIRFVLQTSPTQLVFVDNDRILKFYEFIDKAAKLEEEEKAKQNKEFASLIE